MGIHWQRAHKIQLNAIIKMRVRMLGLSPEPEQYDENIEVSNERWSDILLIFLIKFSKYKVLKIKYSITPDERKLLKPFTCGKHEDGKHKSTMPAKDAIVKKMGQTVIELSHRKTKNELEFRGLLQVAFATLP